MEVRASGAEAVQHEDVWNQRGLLDHIAKIETQMPDASVAFLLGAGASKSSGIATGKELVMTWLNELRRRHLPDDGIELATWATAENLGIDGFEFPLAHQFYPQVFERRFGAFPSEGYAQLEAMSEGIEPAIGYSILARLMSLSRHKVVVTTNFDSLVADALYRYTRTHPLVVGHESLAGFARPKPSRPLVAQIHRNLLLNPINDAARTSALADGWDAPLRAIFQVHSFIVIGYGGNDGSVMGFLQRLQPSQLGGPLIWCYRGESGLPDLRVRQLVAQLRGALVPILGFDELMVEIAKVLNIPLLAPDLEAQATERGEKDRVALEQLEDRLKVAAGGSSTSGKAAGEALKTISATATRVKGWRGWDLKARAAPTPEAARTAYEEGLSEFPNDPDLLMRYGHFEFHEGAFARSEELLRTANKFRPDDARVLGLLAKVVSEDESRNAETLELYERAYALDQSNAEPLSFAVFLALRLKDYARAETVLRGTLRVAPRDPGRVINLVGLLIIRRKFDDAEVQALKGCHLTAGKSDSVAATVAMYRGALARVFGRSDEEAIGRLKTMLSSELDGPHWRYDEVLEGLAEKLGAEDQRLYASIAAAIQDRGKLVQLEQLDRWSKARPRSLSQDWPR